LAYVIRDNDEVAPDDLARNDWDSVDDNLVATSILEGETFSRDSKRVFDILKPFVMEGPGWPFVQPFNRRRDGRAAFTALKLSEIVDHRTNGHAILKDDGFVEDRYGKRHPRISTRGWDLQVEWRDGSTTWVPLLELKESNPIEVAEYAVANKIAEDPAFAWWVCKALRKRDRIIKKVKARYWAKTHKFGIELPKTVAEALKIDESERGPTFGERRSSKK
jgi:hypothetical protein